MNSNKSRAQYYPNSREASGEKDGIGYSQLNIGCHTCGGGGGGEEIGKKTEGEDPLVKLRRMIFHSDMWRKYSNMRKELPLVDFYKKFVTNKNRGKGRRFYYWIKILGQVRVLRKDVEDLNLLCTYIKATGIIEPHSPSKKENDANTLRWENEGKWLMEERNMSLSDVLTWHTFLLRVVVLRLKKLYQYYIPFLHDLDKRCHTIITNRLVNSKLPSYAKILSGDFAVLGMAFEESELEKSMKDVLWDLLDNTKMPPPTDGYNLDLGKHLPSAPPKIPYNPPNAILKHGKGKEVCVSSSTSVTDECNQVPSECLKYKYSDVHVKSNCPTKSPCIPQCPIGCKDAASPTTMEQCETGGEYSALKMEHPLRDRRIAANLTSLLCNYARGVEKVLCVSIHLDTARVEKITQDAETKGNTEGRGRDLDQLVKTMERFGKFKLHQTMIYKLMNDTFGHFNIFALYFENDLKKKASGFYKNIQTYLDSRNLIGLSKLSLDHEDPTGEVDDLDGDGFADETQSTIQKKLLKDARSMHRYLKLLYPKTLKLLLDFERLPVVLKHGVSTGDRTLNSDAHTSVVGRLFVILKKYLNKAIYSDFPPLLDYSEFAEGNLSKTYITDYVKFASKFNERFSYCTHLLRLLCFLSTTPMAGRPNYYRIYQSPRYSLDRCPGDAGKVIRYGFEVLTCHKKTMLPRLDVTLANVLRKYTKYSETLDGKYKLAGDLENKLTSDPYLVTIPYIKSVMDRDRGMDDVLNAEPMERTEEEMAYYLMLLTNLRVTKGLRIKRFSLFTSTVGFIIHLYFQAVGYDRNNTLYRLQSASAGGQHQPILPINTMKLFTESDEDGSIMTASRDLGKQWGVDKLKKIESSVYADGNTTLTDLYDTRGKALREIIINRSTLYSLFHIDMKNNVALLDYQKGMVSVSTALFNYYKSVKASTQWLVYDELVNNNAMLSYAYKQYVSNPENLTRVPSGLLVFKILQEVGEKLRNELTSVHMRINSRLPSEIVVMTPHPKQNMEAKPSPMLPIKDKESPKVTEVVEKEEEREASNDDDDDDAYFNNPEEDGELTSPEGVEMDGQDVAGDDDEYASLAMVGANFFSRDAYLERERRDRELRLKIMYKKKYTDVGYKIGYEDASKGTNTYNIDMKGIELYKFLWFENIPNFVVTTLYLPNMTNPTVVESTRKADEVGSELSVGGVQLYFESLKDNSEFLDTYNASKNLDRDTNIQNLLANSAAKELDVDQLEKFKAKTTNLPLEARRVAWANLRKEKFRRWWFVNAASWKTWAIFYRLNMVHKIERTVNNQGINEIFANPMSLANERANQRISGEKFMNERKYPHPSEMLHIGTMYRKLLEKRGYLYGDTKYGLNAMKPQDRVNIRNYFFNFKKRYGLQGNAGLTQYIVRSVKLYDWVLTNLKPFLYMLLKKFEDDVTPNGQQIDTDVLRPVRPAGVQARKSPQQLDLEPGALSREGQDNTANAFRNDDELVKTTRRTYDPDSESDMTESDVNDLALSDGDSDVDLEYQVDRSMDGVKPIASRFGGGRSLLSSNTRTDTIRGVHPDGGITSTTATITTTDHQLAKDLEQKDGAARVLRKLLNRNALGGGGGGDGKHADGDDSMSASALEKEYMESSVGSGKENMNDLYGTPAQNTLEGTAAFIVEKSRRKFGNYASASEIIPKDRPLFGPLPELIYGDRLSANNPVIEKSFIDDFLASINIIIYEGKVAAKVALRQFKEADKRDEIFSKASVNPGPEPYREEEEEVNNYPSINSRLRCQPQTREEDTNTCVNDMVGVKLGVKKAINNTTDRVKNTVRTELMPSKKPTTDPFQPTRLNEETKGLDACATERLKIHEQQQQLNNQVPAQKVTQDAIKKLAVTLFCAVQTVSKEDYNFQSNVMIMRHASSAQAKTLDTKFKPTFDENMLLNKDKGIPKGGRTFDQRVYDLLRSPLPVSLTYETSDANVKMLKKWREEGKNNQDDKALPDRFTQLLKSCTFVITLEPVTRADTEYEGIGSTKKTADTFFYELRLADENVSIVFNDDLDKVVKKHNDGRRAQQPDIQPNNRVTYVVGDDYDEVRRRFQKWDLEGSSSHHQDGGKQSPEFTISPEYSGQQAPGATGGPKLSKAHAVTVPQSVILVPTLSPDENTLNTTYGPVYNKSLLFCVGGCNQQLQGMQYRRYDSNTTKDVSRVSPLNLISDVIPSRSKLVPGMAMTQTLKVKNTNRQPSKSRMHLEYLDPKPLRYPDFAYVRKSWRNTIDKHHYGVDVNVKDREGKVSKVKNTLDREGVNGSLFTGVVAMDRITSKFTVPHTNEVIDISIAILLTSPMKLLPDMNKKDVDMRSILHHSQVYRFKGESLIKQ